MKIMNRTPRFIHVMAVLFAAGWFVALLLMVRDGPPGELPPLVSWTLIGAVGCAAVGVLIHADRTSAVLLEVDDAGSVTITERTLFRRKVRQLAPTAIMQVTVKESEDQDGAAYFSAVLALSDGSEITVQEGHDRDRIVDVAERLREAFGNM